MLYMTIDFSLEKDGKGAYIWNLHFRYALFFTFSISLRVGEVSGRIIKDEATSFFGVLRCLESKKPYLKKCLFIRAVSKRPCSLFTAISQYLFVQLHLKWARRTGTYLWFRNSCHVILGGEMGGGEARGKTKIFVKLPYLNSRSELLWYDSKFWKHAFNYLKIGSKYH